jgi:lipopolysaccharide export LptBFGC system permease protein LptF
MSNNLHFPKPKRDEFADAMIKALKSTKERFRCQQKRSYQNQENVIEKNIEIKQPFKRKKILLDKNQENAKFNNNYSEQKTNENQNELSDNVYLNNEDNIFADNF